METIMDLLKLSKSKMNDVDKRVEIPHYPLQIQSNTILHLGVGNFHRSHQAYYLHQLLQSNTSDWSICGAGLMPQDINMKETLADQDFLYTLVTQESEKEDACIIGSIRDFIHIPTEFEKYSETCVSKNLKIISLTITEKGYCFDSDMNLDRENRSIRHDLSRKDEAPVSAIGVLAYGLRQRMLSGQSPLTVLSCDNIPENGSVLKRILLQFVKQQGDIALQDYISQSISFPCSMVDRITPTTTEEKKSYLEEKYKIKDGVPVFAEQFIQWVVEDDFKSGRPDWAKAGVTFVDDVKPYELMKIRLLNGGHSSLAYLSLLAGYYYVDDAMHDKKIRNFVFSYMNELKATLEPIEGVDYDAYIQNLLSRFANPAVRDRLLRLAEDGSTKLLNFTIGPLLSLLKMGNQVPNITIVLASWIVYLHQSNTNKDFEVKDPIAGKLQKAAAESLESLSGFLSIQEVFPKEIFQYQDFIDHLERAVIRIREKGISDLIASD